MSYSCVLEIYNILYSSYVRCGYTSGILMQRLKFSAENLKKNRGISNRISITIAYILYINVLLASFRKQVLLIISQRQYFRER